MYLSISHIFIPYGTFATDTPVQHGGGVVQIIGHGHRLRPICCVTPQPSSTITVDAYRKRRIYIYFTRLLILSKFKAKEYVLHRRNRLPLGFKTIRMFVWSSVRDDRVKTQTMVRRQRTRSIKKL